MQSRVNYTLTANVEKLILVEGAGNINGTGNALANTLTGNSGNNALDGGAGADTYVADNPGDSVIEAGAAEARTGIVKSNNLSAGNDSVESKISYALPDTVENLVLTGTNAINGTGNALDNVLTGNSGANVLDGKGGLDTLIGGDGNDHYYLYSGDETVIETNPSPSQRDFIHAMVGGTTNCLTMLRGCMQRTGLRFSEATALTTSYGTTMGKLGLMAVLWTAAMGMTHSGPGQDAMVGAQGRTPSYLLIQPLLLVAVLGTSLTTLAGPVWKATKSFCI